MSETGLLKPSSPSGHRLLDRALLAIDDLAERGTELKWWTFGGGTALMIQTGHRSSKDIDIFIPDPQYLTLLSPRLSAAAVSDCDDYLEQAHYLKLKYPEGEIDFIVADMLSDLPTIPFAHSGYDVPMEPSVEIVLKKLYHRAENLKPRDIFDTAVVLSTDRGPQLMEHLGLLSDTKAALEECLNRIPLPFYEEALAELAIWPEWEWLKPKAFAKVRSLVDAIPMAFSRG